MLCLIFIMNSNICNVSDSPLARSFRSELHTFGMEQWPVPVGRIERPKDWPRQQYQNDDENSAAKAGSEFTVIFVIGVIDLMLFHDSFDSEGDQMSVANRELWSQRSHFFYIVTVKWFCYIFCFVDFTCYLSHMWKRSRRAWLYLLRFLLVCPWNKRSIFRWTEHDFKKARDIKFLRGRKSYQIVWK